MTRVLLGGMMWSVLVVGVFVPSVSHGSITFDFSYSGIFEREHADHGGIEGGKFTLTATFPATPYEDFGDGTPILTADSTLFVVSGAPNPGSNGEYALPGGSLLMFPTLGGVMKTPHTSMPLYWVRVVGPNNEQLRLAPNLPDLFGGSGIAASVGQMPTPADFPTDIATPIMRAFPYNIVYDVLNPSISTGASPNVVPEPSSVVGWLMMGAVGGFVGWRRYRKASH